MHTRKHSHVDTSVAVLAEILFGSPRKMFIFIIRTNIYRIKVSKKRNILNLIKSSLVDTCWPFHLLSRSDAPSSGQYFVTMRFGPLFEASLYSSSIPGYGRSSAVSGRWLMRVLSDISQRRTSAFSMAPSNVRRTLATFSTCSVKIEQSQIPRDLEVFTRVQKFGGSE